MDVLEQRTLDAARAYGRHTRPREETDFMARYFKISGVVSGRFFYFKQPFFFSRRDFSRFNPGFSRTCFVVGEAWNRTKKRRLSF